VISEAGEEWNYVCATILYVQLHILNAGLETPILSASSLTFWNNGIMYN